MTTIRRLIQTSPAKANDLFARLAETSVNALKTRERLFSELKEELELQMRLEEQHLFPVLTGVSSLLGVAAPAVLV